MTILTVLRIAGVLTVLLLGGFVSVMLFREFRARRLAARSTGVGG